MCDWLLKHAAAVLNALLPNELRESRRPTARSDYRSTLIPSLRTKRMYTLASTLNRQGHAAWLAVESFKAADNKSHIRGECSARQLGMQRRASAHLNGSGVRGTYHAS